MHKRTRGGEQQGSQLWDGQREGRAGPKLCVQLTSQPLPALEHLLPLPTASLLNTCFPILHHWAFCLSQRQTPDLEVKGSSTLPFSVEGSDWEEKVQDRPSWMMGKGFL